jgi:hypothetical protein
MSQQDSQAEKLLKDRGIMVWSAPEGYVIRVNDRGGLNPFHIDGDEMDAILAPDRIKRLSIEVLKS